MRQYTEKEKSMLVRRFEQQRHERRSNLISEMEKMGEILESKIQRRRNLVPKKFASLKIKEVLDLEREQKIKMFELIQQVERMKKESVSKEELLYKEMERIRTHRKQSLVAPHRVAKPSR